MITESDSSAFECHLCEDASAKEIFSFARLKQVTSDCRPWKDGGRLGVCDLCGTVQKNAGAAWQTGAEEIYQEYKIYHQAGGVEQAAFDPASGAPSERSRIILEKAVRHLSLAKTGRLLDIGCGNGSLLRTFGAHYPDWALSGTERNQQLSSEVAAIPGVEAVHGIEASEISGIFDMISMVHVLEHIAHPVGFLKTLGKNLSPSGRLLIQVPIFTANPFDLTIADHCSHFTKTAISHLLSKSGFKVLRCEKDWVPKELTVIAAPEQAPATKAGPNPRAFDKAGDAVHWLETFADSIRTATAKGPVAIFGSSIAATWLFGELGGNVSFFVDEDENRIGYTHLDRPIRSPGDVPKNISLALALAPSVANSVADRLAGAGMTLLT
ncbi:MAG: class I SAM-dependent methyltransferase, partial [Rhodospirillales bacterium]|nr:class I SAM-dependent methyltransferase [Rhodospirillales bacterium]